MLPRTPRPMMTESLLGYTLRLAETNGYDTPWHILTYAGFDQAEMRTPSFPVKKLAAIIGREESALRHIAYYTEGSEGRHFKILGHRLGATMKDGWLRLTKPEFCPACVTEDGYLDAFWDLRQAIACPKHECHLMSACPSCRRRLRWFRPGLLECQCGANLAEVPRSPADAAVVLLMAVLRAKLHGKSVLDLPNDVRFPLADLETLPFRSLLMVLDRLVRFAASSVSEAQPVPTQGIEHAAHVLADWPTGYHTFLKRLGSALEPDRPQAIGLRKQFAPFYETMFKRTQLAADFAFLRTEFVNFGQTVWGKAVVDRKLLRDEGLDCRFRSQSETARDIGVRPVTLQRWVDKGLVAATEVAMEGQYRYIFDKARFPLACATAGRVFETRKAAAHVNLPVSVLLGLKDTGHYACENMPRHKRGFHELDLAALRLCILARANPIGEIPQGEPIVSLEYVLQEARFWSKTGKASFVAAYLDGAIDAVGRIGESWSDLFFRRSDVEAQASNSRATQSSGAVSQKEAASQIGCGTDVVVGLLAQGLLEALPGPDRTRVTAASLDRFESGYVGLAALAKRKKSSARRLECLCASRAIDTIGVPRKGGSVAKFIRVTDQHQLLDS